MQKQKESSPSDSSKFRSKSVQSGIKLSSVTKHFLYLLDEFDRYGTHLAATPAINNAIRRYETVWLPLAANYGLVGPPIDVHFVWCVHMLSPVSYKQDCLAITSKLIDHRCLPLKELQKARETSRKTWLARHPSEPFDFDPNSSANLDLLSHSSRLSFGLREAITKHLQFYYQVCLPHYSDPRFLEDAVSRYKKYIFIQLQHPDQVMLPLIDVTLIWHCHKLHPSVYSKDTKSSVDKMLLKNSAKPDLLWWISQLSPDSGGGGNGEGGAVAMDTCLTGGLDTTAELWQLVFKEKYLKPGTQYRGRSVKGKLGALTLADSYLLSTKSAQVQVKSVLIEPHVKLDKFTVQLTNPLVHVGGTSNGVSNGGGGSGLENGSGSNSYMAKLRSPDKFWPNKPGHKFVTNTTLITGTVDSFNVELIDRRGLFCASNAVLATRRVRLLEHIENFLGTEPQNIDLQFDLGKMVESKEKETALGRLNMSLVLYSPERHATRLKLAVGENAILRVPIADISFWGRSFCETGSGNVMSSSISSESNVECYFLSHGIVNHNKKEVLTVRIIHSLLLEKSIVQVLYHNQIVAIAETVGSEQVPIPNAMHNSEMVSLESGKSERAILIKDNEGDWGFLIGRWHPSGNHPQQSRSSSHHHHPHHHHHHHGYPVSNSSMTSSYVSSTNGAGGLGGQPIITPPPLYECDEFARFSIRSYWLRGERRVQYSHIPDSMNSWSVVLNDISFDLLTGEVHISRQCNDIAQSVCLAFSCAVCLALCKPVHLEMAPPPTMSTPSHGPVEIKPPTDTFNTSLFLSPSTEIVSIPPLRDYLVRRKNSSHFSSTFEDPCRLPMCIAVGINLPDQLPTAYNVRLKRTRPPCCAVPCITHCVAAAATAVLSTPSTTSTAVSPFQVLSEGTSDQNTAEE